MSVTAESTAAMTAATLPGAVVAALLAVLRRPTN